jgi:hypothetical protein
MKESQLLKTFNCLTLKDRRALRQFVISPFLNTREDVVLLFDYLDKNRDNLNRDLSKETVFKAVFTEGGIFDLKKLNYTLSFLDNLIREYLIFNQLQNETAERDVLLQKAFLGRRADKLAEKSLSVARQNLNAQELKNATTHLHEFQWHKTQYDYASRTERSDDTSLQESTDAFTDFTVAETLRQACAMLSQQAFSKRTYRLPLLEAALNIAVLKIENSAIKTSESPAVFAYFHAYQSLTKEEDETIQYAHFQSFKTILENNWQQFPADEMHGLYVLAINFCLKKINRGHRQFEKEVLSIYKIGLHNRLLFENNQLSPYTYKNAMMAALKVGETDWANQFLEEYKTHLPVRDRENLFQYNKAIFYFRNKEYTAAMQLLQTVNLREVLFNLDARRILARVYFELKEFNALDSLIESSKIYLHRQKDIGYHREMYLNFFKILEILLKKEDKKPEILRGVIEETKYLAEREWLLITLFK